MKTSASCPACGGRIGFWTVFKAPTPFELRCPGCKAKLKVVLPGLWVLFATAISLFVLLGLGTLYAYRHYGSPLFLCGISALVVLWALVEVSMALLFFNGARFDVPEKKKKAP